MNKLTKGLILVALSAVMGSAFAIPANPASGVALSGLGDAQGGNGNQKGLVNNSGKANQTGLINTQTTKSAGSQQGAINIQSNQKTGNASSSQSKNTQASLLQIQGGPTNTANLMGNEAVNVNQVQ